LGPMGERLNHRGPGVVAEPDLRPARHGHSDARHGPTGPGDWRGRHGEYRGANVVEWI
jgi:hypothetical protein